MILPVFRAKATSSGSNTNSKRHVTSEFSRLKLGLFGLIIRPAWNFDILSQLGPWKNQIQKAQSLVLRLKRIASMGLVDGTHMVQHEPSDSVSSIGFSPRGCDKIEKLWPLTSGGQLIQDVEPRLSGSVSCLVFSPKLNYSVATSWDNQGVDAGGHAWDSSLGLLASSNLEPLTEQLLVAVYSFRQSSQQAEDAYSRGMEKLQQILVESLHPSPWELLVWQIK
ncbi:uncharacterized protein A4U43_C03F4110 [Asparagus officinalis]|uniref:Uncharacterized protein n=1 Tax=Asparagus officinalis TaxID=4686 RepID=A0A5P1F783_ASPOF|nr:uncharacterized protein A4U43_C03F4110 [Asparagus officinalis]